MDESAMRRKVAEARVARVGTLDQRGSIHLVPVVYAMDGDTWYSPSDAGPARSSGCVTSWPMIAGPGRTALAVVYRPGAPAVRAGART